MNRNLNAKFSTAFSGIDIDRSRFHRPSGHKTTMNAGYLVPIYVDEILPGDGFNMSVATMARMSTPIFPVADSCWLETFWFYVPNRLLWDNWKAFMGEVNASDWNTRTDYEVPVLKTAPGNVGFTYKFGGVGDHMSIPPGYPNLPASALGLRAYRLIWNEWFRDTNLQDPLLVNTGDTEYDATLDDLLKVAKQHDYFTSCRTEPQRGPAVLIPFDVNAEAGYLPVLTRNVKHTESNITLTFGGFPSSVTQRQPLYVNASDDGKLNAGSTGYEGTSFSNLYPNNLYAKLDSSFIGAGTISQLRTAFQIQKLYERDSRCGTRYVELLKSHFGVTAPDASLQRPQYLGGEKIAITINQVVQTSSTDDTSPQGNVAAFSKTVSKNHIFDQSFYEHGLIIGLACVRTAHTYQQGLNRMWSRKTRLDYYTPELANISEMAVKNKEIYISYSDPANTAWSPENEEIFGYQEAWADYRYKPSTVSGAFRSNYPGGTLDAWTYADYFDERPVLSAEFIEETDENINRTLAVQSDIADQFLVDFWFDLYSDRPMPVTSIPGLADHH